MEVLALLLLGLIAMLAIVPPIIRGKLDESPLATSQNFQRSMQEMANSLEPFGRQDERSYRDAGYANAAGPARMRRQISPHRAGTRPSRHGGAAVRRSRIVTVLAIFASFWGVAALTSGKAWCLVAFAIASCLLVIYWTLALLVPHISSPARTTRRIEEVSSSPDSQAM